MSLSGSSWRRALTIVSAFVLCSPGELVAQQYQQNNLVSDTQAEGTNPADPQLKNPWGIARFTGGPWWVSDNAAGVSTLQLAKRDVRALGRNVLVKGEK